jgi:aminoglycoside phosphotransferase
MRPSVVAALHGRHELLTSAGVPVPRSFGHTESGLLVMEAIPGPTLRQHLRSGGLAPSGEQLLGLLARLPVEVMDLPVRRSWADEARHYAAIVGSSLPEEQSRAADLAELIEQGLAGLVPDVPTHGDFHDDQVVVAGSSIRGLLDVDTLGPGRRADDVATMLGHLEASVVLGAPHPEHLMGLVRDVQVAAESVVDAAELRLRVAGVLMSLATGPFRTQQQGWERATTLHLDAVQRWVEHAQQLRR